MMKMLKMIGYGLIIWVVPYVTAIMLMGLMTSDPVFFKSIMIVEGSIIGAICMAAYFSNVNKDTLKESLIVGLVWVVISWALDFAALLPFSKMPLDRYFMEIGIRYVGMLAPIVAIGYLLDKRIKT
ncbi:MAG: hypothetical protein JW782_03245 [Candidatus Saganbacteria bacterium]|nr:hypothetical protein [Candidatus Saganbacteria bacterium]